MIPSSFVNNYGDYLSKRSLSDFKIHSYQCTFCVILPKHSSAVKAEKGDRGASKNNFPFPFFVL